MRHNDQLCRSFELCHHGCLAGCQHAYTFLQDTPLQRGVQFQKCSSQRTSLRALLLLLHCPNPSAAAAWSAASALLEPSETRCACGGGCNAPAPRGSAIESREGDTPRELAGVALHAEPHHPIS